MKDNSNIDEILGNFDTWCFCKASECVLAQNFEEAKQAIQQELLKARIDELKRLKKIDAFNEQYATDPRPAKLVDIRIAYLQKLQAS